MWLSYTILRFASKPSLCTKIKLYGINLTIKIKLILILQRLAKLIKPGDLVVYITLLAYKSFEVFKFKNEVFQIFN